MVRVASSDKFVHMNAAISCLAVAFENYTLDSPRYCWRPGWHITIAANHERGHSSQSAVVSARLLLYS